MTLKTFKEDYKEEGWIFQNNGYWYFKRRDTTKKNNQGDIFSCKTKDDQEAMKIIKGWIKDGFPQTKKDKENDILFNDYLLNFWSEKSDYYKKASIEGRHVTKNYFKKTRQAMQKHVTPFFKGVRLSEIDEKILNDFFSELTNDTNPKGELLSNGTLKGIKSSITTALRYGREKTIIKQVIDFTIIFPNLKAKEKHHRGILSEEETQAIINFEWESPKAYLYFCIAINTGMRLSEIRTLKFGSISEHYITVKTSYNDVDKLKCTKTGKIRLTPITNEMYYQICAYRLSLPIDERSDDCFIFADDEDKSKPCGACFARRHFYRVLNKLGIPRFRINPDTEQEEEICFHSLRHQTATRWASSGLDMRMIAEAMGHSTTMLQHYSDHFNRKNVETLANDLDKCGALGIQKEEPQSNIIQMRA